MHYGGTVCTILNNVLQKVIRILLTTYTVLPDAPNKSGRTLKYVIVIMYIGPIHIGLRAIMYFYLFYTTMSECMLFYGPIVPEINYYIILYCCREIFLGLSFFLGIW